MRENPPEEVQLDKVVREVLASKPRVTRFNINWYVAAGLTSGTTPASRSGRLRKTLRRYKRVLLRTRPTHSPTPCSAQHPRRLPQVAARSRRSRSECVMRRGTIPLFFEPVEQACWAGKTVEIDGLSPTRHAVLEHKCQVPAAVSRATYWKSEGVRPQRSAASTNACTAPTGVRFSPAKSAGFASRPRALIAPRAPVRSRHAMASARVHTSPLTTHGASPPAPPSSPIAHASPGDVPRAVCSPHAFAASTANLTASRSTGCVDGWCRVRP